MSSEVSQTTLTESLLPQNQEQAIARLKAYFKRSTPTSGYTGSRFDTWHSLAAAADDSDVFTADDLLAVTFLSVRVPAAAAIDILDEKRADFTSLLKDIGPDRDLATVEEPIGETSAAWRLNTALREYKGVGATIASKLMARKRPRLIPIYDTVINQHVLGGSGVQWQPMRLALRANDYELHNRLLKLRDDAGLDDRISALRVFDVLAWMDGKDADRANRRA